MGFPVDLFLTYREPFIMSLFRGGTGLLLMKNMQRDFKATVTFLYKRYNAQRGTLKSL